MIYLEKGQKLFDNTGAVVYDPTGYYEDGASVLCAMSYAPEEPVCRYEAKFIAFGSMVYNVTDPEKLLEEIKKIDPETLFGKSTADISLDKKIQDIETVDTTENPEDTKEETEEETNNETEAVDESGGEAEVPATDPVLPEETSSSTDPISSPLTPEETSSSTEPFSTPVTPEETSSSTSPTPVIETVPEETPTLSPETPTETPVPETESQSVLTE